MDRWTSELQNEAVLHVAGPSAKYQITGRADAVELSITADDGTTETMVQRRDGHAETIDWHSSDGRSARLMIAPSKEGYLRSDVTIGNESFTVESDRESHGFALARALKSRDYPRSQYLSALVDRARDDQRLRAQIGEAGREMMLIPNGVIWACAAICLACAGEFVIACFRCLICIERVGGGGIAISGVKTRESAAASQRPRIRAGDTLSEAHLGVLTRALGALRPELGFECGGPICICRGDDDCGDLFGSEVCGDGICFEGLSGEVVCLCVRNR
jgi:hypothetical protein